MEAILQLHRRISRFDARLMDWGGSIMSLVIRIFVGWQFFKSGMVKCLISVFSTVKREMPAR